MPKKKDKDLLPDDIVEKIIENKPDPIVLEKVDLKLSGWSPEVLSQMAEMRGYGLTIKQIASLYRIPWTTFEERMAKYPDIKEALDAGRAQAVANVSRTLYQMAQSGMVPSATYFYLKCQAGWKEKNDVQIHKHEHKTLSELVTGSYKGVEHKETIDNSDDD